MGKEADSVAPGDRVGSGDSAADRTDTDAMGKSAMGKSDDAAAGGVDRVDDAADTGGKKAGKKESDSTDQTGADRGSGASGDRVEGDAGATTSKSAKKKSAQKLVATSTGVSAKGYKSSGSWSTTVGIVAGVAMAVAVVAVVRRNAVQNKYTSLGQSEVASTSTEMTKLVGNADTFQNVMYGEPAHV
eukprot:m.126749 g.126749  ORF g.126749 m.126749 type:complete len:187 (-) comp17388_c0_seq1:279-839(-)